MIRNDYQRAVTIERQQRKESRRSDDSAFSELRLIPTCPPSTSVIMLAGKIWGNATYWFWINFDIQVPSQTIDLSDGSDIADSATGSPLQVSFANANYYTPLILSVNYNWVLYGREKGDVQYKFLYLGADTEYPTSLQAEEWLDARLHGVDQPYNWDRMPLAALVLRNNGTINVTNQFMPVDMLNRERSYLYRDMRPRNRIVA